MSPAYKKLQNIKFDNIFDFIFKLEQGCELEEENPDTITKFAKCLSENASKILLGTSEPATSQSGTSQSGTSQPGRPTSTESPNTTRDRGVEDEPDNAAVATSTTPMEH
ncbi:uncharacterized protein [Antedon mediterranea]|uniref:uncharacterized protein isoform X2 n=1 Tax=Antedon mediterranea TaxID=105859 RepID=UPI003AF46580